MEEDRLQVCICVYRAYIKNTVLAEKKMTLKHDNE